jgi:cell wall-associated NlpC family hydrolase
MSAFTRGRRLLALPMTILAASALTVSLCAPADAVTTRQRKITYGLQVARDQKGDPYRWGAEGPFRFDCSGLTMFSYARAGLFLPRTSDAQARYTRRIRKSNIRPGDLMFFHSGGDVYHVGVFAGWNGRGSALVLHAPRPGQRVHTSTAWTRRWYPGTVRRR